LEYFTDIWDILGTFSTFCVHLVHFSVLVSCTKKNLASLILARKKKSDLPVFQAAAVAAAVAGSGGAAGPDPAFFSSSAVEASRYYQMHYENAASQGEGSLYNIQTYRPDVTNIGERF
jgi:hypothetical protein